MSNSGRARLGRGRGRSGSLHSGGASSSANPTSSAARLPVVRLHSGGSSQFHHPQPNVDPWVDSTNPQHFEDGFSSHENQSNQFTLENLLADPNREISLPKLDPFPTEGTIWFDRDRARKIPKHVSNIIRAGYADVYLSWTKTPTDVRDQFFIKFAQIYYWNPSLTHTVREEFDKIGVKRMKGITTQIKNMGHCPAWLNGDVYARLCQYWATEEAKAKGKKTRDARLSDRDGCGPHKHTSGQKSFYTVQCDLEDELGHPASYGAVFKKTHSGSDGSYIDLKAKQVSETFEQIRSDFLHSQMDSNTDLSDGVSQPIQLTPDQENQLFLQATVPDKNGNVYGLGNLSAKVAGGKNKRGVDSAVTDTLTHLQHEFASYKDETQQQMTTLAQQNQQLLQFLQSQFPSFPPHLASMMMPPPSTRPDGSGSSANQDDQSPDF